MFSQVCVILFTGGSALPQFHWSGSPRMDAAPSGWMHHPPRMDEPHPQKTDGQQAGGTHPTGMHTCLPKFALVAAKET